MKVVGYCRVSTEEQAKSGLGLEAQRDRIEEEAFRRRWTVTWIVDEGQGASTLNRPGIQRALNGLSLGYWNGLVAAKLDRVSRSVVDLSGLLRRAAHERWDLILLDLGLDTTTASGKLVAHLMGSVAEFERERIGDRTREALVQARKRGVILGRPRVLPREVVERIMSERESGQPLQAIAESLNREGIPTAHGGKRWYHSTVRAVLGRNVHA